MAYKVVKPEKQLEVHHFTFVADDLNSIPETYHAATHYCSVLHLHCDLRYHIVMEKNEVHAIPYSDSKTSIYEYRRRLYNE